MVNGLQFSDKLLTTPLFQGLSKSDLQEIVGHTKFSFAKYKEGETIAEADSPCTELLMLMSGQMQAETVAADHSYRMTEYISTPLIQPERLFGFHQNYSSTFRAHTPCSIIGLSKAEVINLYNNYEVFRINLTNHLATAFQRATDCQWASGRHTLRMRIIRFFTLHSLYPAGEKHLSIRMNDLAAELNDSRLNISRELNRLRNEGLLGLSRGKIHIPALERLYM